MRMWEESALRGIELCGERATYVRSALRTAQLVVRHPEECSLEFDFL